MVKVDGKRIEMAKGDTCILSISIKDTEGNDYTPQTGDVIRFAMKQRYTDANTIINKVIPNDTLDLRIEPNDTKSLTTGKYYFDVELTKADGTVDTFIPEGELVLKEEIC